MSIERLTKDMNIIAKLPDEPNDVGGLTAEELKGKFDEGGVALKEFINESLLPALEELGVESTVQCVDPTLLKYLTVGDEGELRYSADGEVWSILPGGVDGADGKDGTDGTDGTGFICCTASVSSAATDVPVTKSQLKYPALRPIQDGDLVLCANGTVCSVSYYDGSYYHLKSTGISIKGADGAQGEQGEQGEQGPAGADGEDGYTPVRGTDYWTDEDKAAIVADTLAQLPEGDCDLPAVTTADEGKILQVAGGAWSVVAVADSAVATYVDDYISEALGGEY